ncbi:hypothetical protein NONO_c08370 [Nocardia nova SH22a]|uniref:Secreted protein n=1 Tax=Nocardia nova SH22a TaxID=1415166 RepID=W5T931_9NOCA|nr:hypothetical protein [Nocardia nova]AHH15644.1 hypothetical protein NONO_c08370 [Nocardia nova SH22a]
MRPTARAGGRLLVAVLCVVFAWAVAPTALADAPAAGGDLSIAQTLGDRELTVILRRVTSVPGPLRVEVVSHTGTAAGRLALDLTPTGASSSSRTPAPGAPVDHGAIDLGAAPGMYSTTLRVDRPGPWELAVGDGSRVARIPFVVPAQIVTPPERFVYGGFVVAGVLLPVAAVVAIRARRGAWALLPAAGVVAGVAVAVTAAVLSTSLPLPPQPGIQLDPSVDDVRDPYAARQPSISDFSRPPVMLSLGGTPLRAGVPGDLELRLGDAATGLPVDDLTVVDEAFIHALVVGPSGELAHTHPIRVAPGTYLLHLTAPEPGHYALSIELERRGGGVRMIRAAAGFDVGPGAADVRTDFGGHLARVSGPGTAAAPLHPGLRATATGDGVPIEIVTTAAAVGAPLTITAKVGDRAELQPWLGMVGHMIVAGPLPAGTDLGTAVERAPVWGHAHSMGSMGMSADTDGRMVNMPGMDHMSAPNADAMLMPPVNGDSAPDETVAAYGPSVPFTYTFAVPGRYHVWIQVERDYTILTIPLVLDIPSGGPR